MKSKSSFVLGLMMSVSLVALTGCDEPKVDASIYSSLDQCKETHSFRQMNVRKASEKPKANTLQWLPNMLQNPTVRLILVRINVNKLLTEVLVVVLFLCP